MIPFNLVKSIKADHPLVAALRKKGQSTITLVPAEQRDIDLAARVGLKPRKNFSGDPAYTGTLEQGNDYFERGGHTRWFNERGG